MRTLILIFGISFFPLFTFGQISLRDAKEAPIPIAIQPFISKPENSKVAAELEGNLTADLIFSRVFKVITSDALSATMDPQVKGPIEILEVAPFRELAVPYVVRAEVRVEKNETILDGLAFDVSTAKARVQKTYRTRRKDIEILAHQFGDDIVEMVTGQPGLFSTKIAFSYTPPGGGKKEIWVMDFNGRNPKPLVQNGRMNLSSMWTSDGRFIYYTSSSVIDWHLWKTDLAGKQTQVTKYRGSALGPALMPNGREIVISLSKDGDTELYLIGLDGKVIRRLSKRRGIDMSPFPSPDGKEICFSSDRLGNLHVFKMNLATEEVTRLTRVGTLNDSCVWSPLSDLILFSGMDTDRDFDIFAMNDRGEEMERLTYDASNNESPSFSPDGRLVTFSSKRSGRNQIYVMKIDGTQLLPMSDLPGDATQPAWSPRLGY